MMPAVAYATSWDDHTDLTAIANGNTTNPVKIKASHITQMRNVIDTLRGTAACGSLAPLNWRTIGTGVSIAADDVNAIKTEISDPRYNIPAGLINAIPNIPPASTNSTLIRASHIVALRAAIDAANCTGGVCNSDGIQNNGETGIDCGGGGCGACTVYVSSPYQTTLSVTGVVGYPVSPILAGPNGSDDKKGTHSAFTGTISATTGAATPVTDTNLSLVKNGSLIQCFDVPKAGYTSQSHTFNSTTFAATDSLNVSLNSGLCPAAPTCSDGIQNQGELGIDCGGPNCPACTCCDNVTIFCPVVYGDEYCMMDAACGPGTGTCQRHCSDGIQNLGETNIDCGGTCPACPSECWGCFDGPTCTGTNISYCLSDGSIAQTNACHAGCTMPNNDCQVPVSYCAPTCFSTTANLGTGPVPSGDICSNPYTTYYISPTPGFVSGNAVYTDSACTSVVSGSLIRDGGGTVYNLAGNIIGSPTGDSC